jgi:ATPase family associated with various cellular activities (AAA)
MSLAGKRSTQGDEYQLRIALHWLIRLLTDKSIQCIQVNSTGIPGRDSQVTVDDVVVIYQDGHICFIQAKKNQTDHEAWTLSDKTLKAELKKACEQLESEEKSEVKFYSRSPFGELKALVETCQNFPDYSSFLRQNNQKQKAVLKDLACVMGRSEEVTFDLTRRIDFGAPYEFEDWDRYNLQDLGRILPCADLAKPVLERYLSNHEASLQSSKYTITREDILSKLAQHGLSLAPQRSEVEILETFKKASSIGRHWLRTIDSKKISRSELRQLTELIKQGSKTILLTDRPGSGKTCLLLDLVDELEKADFPYGLLFIKGDQFVEINNESDLTDRGLPEDIFGQCARLASFRRVVVVIDSLDVLSLNHQHNALKVFLGLIDRLEKVENVVVVAACRNFDLQYDPLLRGRSWQQTIEIQPLDFDIVVKPFLSSWNINPSRLSLELRKLLQTPQHLRIYEKLARLGKDLNPASSYELYNSFVEEVVAQNPLLGNEAMSALQNMADHLTQARSQSCSKRVFKASDDITRLLISQEVLWESSPGKLSFSHQTLADCLIVHSALAQDKTFTDFVLEHPQLPFIRPAVRAFFFFLRVQEPVAFRKQIWQVLSHEEVEYHVKRLICESFAEIVPLEEDWRLLCRIFQTYPDLFRRLLIRVEENVWFGFLKQNWLAEAQGSANREDWLQQFCWKLQVWVNHYPTEVIALWKEAIANQWVGSPNLIRTISSGLEKFEIWDAEGVRELLEMLVENGEAESSYLGDILSRWVQAVNSGDDLLWRFITKDVTAEGMCRQEIGSQLHCKPHDFRQENFLAERLEQSDELLDLALDSLECWSNDCAPEYKRDALRTGFLRETSWRLKHNGTEYHHVDALTFLFSSLESSLKCRSRRNDRWWEANEPRLRTTLDAALRYLVIQAYKENIHSNLIGIESQLKDEVLLRWNNLSWINLNYVWSELMQMTYPSISDSAQTANQTLILALYSAVYDDADMEEESELAIRIASQNQKICNLLTWIPSIFRTPEAQSHIDNWQNHFDPHHFSPDIHSWGGRVMPPLSKEDLLKLSDRSIFRLLTYYEQSPNRGGYNREMIGGFRDVVWVLREACSIDPIRFLGLFPLFITNDLHHDYIHAVVAGIASHLTYRFGNLSSNDWQLIDPPPDGKSLATTLLSLLERHTVIWEDRDVVSRALEACCNVLDDFEAADRIALLLFWVLSNEEDEYASLADNPKELVSKSFNSTRGVVAKSTVSLHNRLLENAQPIPELLLYLLEGFTRDPAIYARLPVLMQLPFLMYKQPDLGWRLLANIFQEPQPHLWKHAERCLYYQYRDHFDRVAPYLTRLMSEGLEEAGDSWGRISTLATLAGQMSQQELFESLSTASSSAWEGAAQVFVANLERREDTEACHSGLVAILRHENLSSEVIGEIATCFKKYSNARLIQQEFVLAFLDALTPSIDGHDLNNFLEWLSHEARRNPLFALTLTERLAEKLELEMRSCQIWHTQPLITSLNEILREADETDDPTLIQRAIRLQDRFFRLNIYGLSEGIETLLSQAGQH